ncbi:MAG TPA: NifU family protein [Labilithrix sp.]|jgi:Fe-S cluster biogenesis protein NfuA
MPEDLASSTKSAGPPAGDGVSAGVAKALSEYVAALVKADGGELWLVSASDDDVHVHLCGTCAGCPGSTMTRERLVEPTVRNVVPKANIKVTTGPRVPEGAKKID